MTPQQRHAAFRELAATLEGIDLPAYTELGRDWQEPVIGEGHPQAPIAFFGRDPGRDELRYQQPFIGAAGQQVRGALYQHLHGEPMPDFAASQRVGEGYFWANTVPYKPLGNKAWSMKVKKRFQPLVADLLLNAWQGQEIITLGREAFFWFAINQPRQIKQQLEAFWAREDRFSGHVTVVLENAECSRPLHLHPLPHPSPLNATWYKRFPGLLRARLGQLQPR